MSWQHQQSVPWKTKSHSDAARRLQKWLSSCIFMTGFHPKTTYFFFVFFSNFYSIAFSSKLLVFFATKLLLISCYFCVLKIFFYYYYCFSLTNHTMSTTSFFKDYHHSKKKKKNQTYELFTHWGKFMDNKKEEAAHILYLTFRKSSKQII